MLPSPESLNIDGVVLSHRPEGLAAAGQTFDRQLMIGKALDHVRRCPDRRSGSTSLTIYALSGQPQLERDSESASVSRYGEFPRLTPARGEAVRAVIAQFCVARSGAPLYPW